jgi:hypothetical protein
MNKAVGLNCLSAYNTKKKQPKSSKKETKSKN